MKSHSHAVALWHREHIENTSTHASPEHRCSFPNCWFAWLKLSDHPLRGVSWFKPVLLILVMMVALSQAPRGDRSSRKFLALLMKALSWTSWANSVLRECLRAVKAHLWMILWDLGWKCFFSWWLCFIAEGHTAGTFSFVDGVSSNYEVFAFRNLFD